MRPEDLERALHRKPFQPIRVLLTDGRSYEICYPHQAVVGKTFFDIGIPASSQPVPIYDHVESVDPADIERLEPLETPVSSADT
jgi:hypothetical protein